MTFYEWYQARFGGKAAADRPSTEKAYELWLRLQAAKGASDAGH